MKRFMMILGLLASLSLTACWGSGGGGGGSDGGGGGDDPPAQGQDVTMDELAGVYELLGFTVLLSDGSTIDETMVDSFEGEMVIHPDGRVTQFVTVNGVPVFIESHIEIVDSNTFRVTNGCNFELGFEWDDPFLTTFFGQEDAQKCQGDDFAEEDRWERVGDIQAQTSRMAFDEALTGFGSFGALVGPTP